MAVVDLRGFLVAQGALLRVKQANRFFFGDLVEVASLLNLTLPVPLVPTPLVGGVALAAVRVVRSVDGLSAFAAWLHATMLQNNRYRQTQSAVSVLTTDTSMALPQVLSWTPVNENSAAYTPSASEKPPMSLTLTAMSMVMV